MHSTNKFHEKNLTYFFWVINPENQNLRLLRRGKAMSGAPIIKGTSQLPKNPIKIGITIKKIIIKAWAVTTTLYSWSSIKIVPAPANSIRIKALNLVPTIPAQTPRIKYKVPMSLWLVDISHFLVLIILPNSDYTYNWG